MTYLTSFDGKEIWYKVFEGKEPALLFIHGYAMNSTVWKNQLDYFKDNKRIVFDLRGHGKSHKEPASNIETLTKDINTILTREKIKKVVLIGHSLGGMISLLFQKMFPEKTEKMVLINPYINKQQLTLRSKFLFWLLNFLFVYPKFSFDHSKKGSFKVLKCVFSTNINTLKFGKKHYFLDYNFQFPQKDLIINSSKDEIIKPYFKEGITIQGTHTIQVDKAEEVNESIRKFL